MTNFNESAGRSVSSEEYYSTVTAAKELLPGRHGHRKLLALLVHLEGVDKSYLPIGGFNDKAFVKRRRKIRVKANGIKVVRHTLYLSKAGIEYLRKLITTYRNFPWCLEFRCIDLIRVKMIEMDSLKPSSEMPNIEIG